MTESKAAPRGGLEGVYAADSAIGKIDGEVGELRYCGYLLKDLADNTDFVETTWLLWNGELPSQADLDSFRPAMRQERGLSKEILSLIAQLTPALSPMDCMRTVVSALCYDDSPNAGDDRSTNLHRGIRIQAKLPTMVAAYARIRDGKEPLEPRQDLTHAANFLYMLTGQVPTDEEARILDVCLILHAEHGFNASTFAARVTAATLSDMYSAITSAIGTLKGPLHGGANTAVMQMLLDI
ncbi:MAG: citrate/2-methylcitrate synthase, partial [Planctomycetota bacterium]